MPGVRIDRENARACALLALVYVCGVGAVTFRPEGSSVATWWPAAGFAAALVVLGFRPRWPRYVVALAVVVALANLTGGRDLVTSSLFGLANAAEALVVGLLLQRRDRRPTLATPEDYLHLVRACVAGASTLAVGVALVVAAQGGDPWLTARTVGPSHLAALLVVLPVLLVDRRRVVRLSLRPGVRLELLAQLSLLAAVVAVVFSPGRDLALAFLPLPVLIWGALRLHPLVAAGEVLALGVVTTWATAQGHGPFGVGSDTTATGPVLAGSQVQVFLLCAAVMAVTTALAAAQRAELLRGLRRERALSTQMLEATATIIIVVDRAGRMLRVNPATHRLLGFADDELLGQPIWRTPMIPAERREVVRAIFASADGSSVPSRREADLLTRDGERRRVVWTNTVVRDDQGLVDHVVFTAVDVTQERTTDGMLRHLLESPMATVLVGLDVAGRVTVFNRGAEDLFGHSTADVLGRPVQDLVLSGQPDAYLSRDRLREQRGVPVRPLDLAETGDWTWSGAGGEWPTVSTTISVVTDVVGETIGYLCVGRDVTDQRRTQQVLVDTLAKEREAVERLRRLDAAKNEFVSTVSHELRTPTTSIVGYTEMLRDGSAVDPLPEQLPMLDAIARNGARLIAVASDLLVLSELEEHGSAAGERRPVDLAAVVRQAEEAVRPLLLGRDLRVEFAAARRIVVTGDATHLDRVLMNLLSNAVKFTPDGGTIRCRLQTRGGQATLVVSDTGIGIPEEEQGELFTKFFRSSVAQEAAIQGTGLGLSIIAAIVQAHDGEIEVRSARGQGTTFTVRLPLAQPVLRAV